MMHSTLVILQIILGLCLIVVILIQPGKTDGLNFISGGASDSFFSKNKSRTHEALQVKITIVLTILFAIVTILSGLKK